MSRSHRLTLREIREVNAIVEDASELGTEPDAWRPFLANRTLDLIRARVAISMDCTNAIPGSIPQLIAPYDIGMEARDHRRLHEYFSSGEVVEDPSAMELFRRHEQVRFLTAPRRVLAKDREWYACPSVSEARRGANIDDFLCSSVALAPHVLQGFIFYRNWGDTPFSMKERRVLRYLHLCLLRRLRESAEAHRRIAAELDLSPRLHQTFGLLLGGDGAKRMAYELGVSLHTVNGYVKTIYRRMNVRSRLELIMATRKWYPRSFLLPQGLIAALNNVGKSRILRIPNRTESSDNGQDEAWGG